MATADPLARYRAKRNFRRTSEPAGKKASAGKTLRFVVQKHDARRLHFDFRLELDGVLKSWAVPKGPSLDPRDKRLAVHVEDHPVEYADFEGTIPEGEYGGGTVQLWDRGTWSPGDSADPHEGLRKGHLRFDLRGKRLSGGWSLVRLRGRNGKKRENWLLIKSRDAAARPGKGDMLTKLDASVRSGRGMAQIAKGRTVIQGVTLSSPDKVLWPEPGVTKRRLADYYADAADRLLPFLRNRPVSIIRAPDGIEKEKFFQRHAGPSTSSLIKLAKVPGDKKPYLMVTDAPGLIALAQIAAVELHPWGATMDDIEKPDQLVFDLDPAPDVKFAGVIEAAKDFRERIENIGFAAFAKLTGGKGIHVVVPLKPHAKWAEAKAFARALCQAAASDSPDRYTMTMAKKERTGRIFLDYLRNDRSASAVAPWSPRARPRATIAVPLPWSAIKAGLDPADYTILTAGKLLRRADAWADFNRARRPLSDEQLKKSR